MFLTNYIQTECLTNFRLCRNLTLINPSISRLSGRYSLKNCKKKWNNLFITSYSAYNCSYKLTKDHSSDPSLCIAWKRWSFVYVRIPIVIIWISRERIHETWINMHRNHMNNLNRSVLCELTALSPRFFTRQLSNAVIPIVTKRKLEQNLLYTLNSFLKLNTPITSYISSSCIIKIWYSIVFLPIWRWSICFRKHY